MIERDPDVRLAVLRQFLDGLVPNAASVSASLGVSDADVGAAFVRLAEGRAFVLRSGTREILMAAPFAAHPSGFGVEVAGKHVEANCVWDALGVSAMTDSDVKITTVCPCCDAGLKLHVAGGVAGGDESIVHFAVPAARWWDDIAFT